MQKNSSARTAISHIPVAEDVSVDNRPTPFAQAVVPASFGCSPDSAESVSSRGIDQRVDRLLAENLALMSERAELRRNMTSTHERSNECLAEARKAKKLVREYFRTKKVLEDWEIGRGGPDLSEARDEFTAAREAVETWALETL